MAKKKDAYLTGSLFGDATHNALNAFNPNFQFHFSEFPILQKEIINSSSQLLVSTG